MFTIIFAFGSILILILLIQLIRRVSLDNEIHRVSLRKSTDTILESDIQRIWELFFASYLFIHISSKSTPTDKQFYEYRDSFIEMFFLIIGKKQTDLYITVYGSHESFNQYLKFKFEQAFKSEIIQHIIIDKINDVNDSNDLKTKAVKVNE